MMQRRLVCLMAGLLLLAVAKPAAAAEQRKIAWHTDVETAWKQTQQDRRPLLVVVTREQCGPCRKLKQGAEGDPVLAATINSGYVPLELNGASDLPLVKELKVTSYPTIFVISPQAVVLERITGYVDPKQFAQRLASAKMNETKVATAVAKNQATADKNPYRTTKAGPRGQPAPIKPAVRPVAARDL